MRSTRSLMLSLALAASASLASGCATKGPQSAFYPSPADLAIEPKPVLEPEAIYSEAALDAYDIAIEARGDRLAAQVGRLCRFFDMMGMRGLDCPPPPRPG
ncbi:hypothetical protein PFY01_08955 [Brevundimonas vesicularis]|uniref:hypothetical protein n=1 Tax=Brevundimonas vesicularis TaxID=41276 RepID=UPI0022EC333B|nr:hypothetical protein [Brevundimonas vesicularis]WBT04788.1 hypothetical protein PFY01_08535 [Brevundimonas vesicularis]WBT04870.1 hypothetical protein PFY01_08955 [Brevundimonas vesicularis]